MTKEKLLNELKKRKYLETPSLIRAFEKVDRKDFVPPDLAREAYEDYPLPIGFGQTISQPRTVAFMLELLLPKPGDRVLEIGAGSGWVTALLAETVRGPSIVGVGRVASHQKWRGSVVAVERITELEEMAEQNVAKYGFVKDGTVELVLGDGTKGCARRAPFDKIISAAASDFIPVAWKGQLFVGGRIVAPVGSTITVLEKLSSSDYLTQVYHGFRFVPLVSDEGGDSSSG
jgi:protein-L-isoaspartate(D-aspartate) O-methyltransferase